MALGDSITAGLFATPSEIPDIIDSLTDSPLQRPFSYMRNRLQRYMGDENSNLIPGFEEYRGVSYATGVDVGVKSLPNVSLASNIRFFPKVCLWTLQMIQHYRTESIKGTSHNHHPPPIIPSPPQRRKYPNHSPLEPMLIFENLNSDRRSCSGE
jgi:hypothetical protein